MAATEYYMGTAAAQQMAGHQRPPSYELPTQHHLTHSYSQPPTQLQQSSNNPPSYTPYPSQPPQHQLQVHPPQGYPPPPQQQQQHQQQQQQPYFPPPPTSSSHRLGAPLQQYRSHSQPPAPRVRFASTDEYASDSGRSYASDDKSPHRRHKRRHHHHRRHRSSDDRATSDRSYDDRDYDDRGYDDHSYDDRNRYHKNNHHKKPHKDRDTFLGAGVGGVIGDAIFPGLGTVGGLLLGGYGGRKRAVRKERKMARDGEDDDVALGRRDKYGEDYGERRERYPADYRNDFDNERLAGEKRGRRDGGYSGGYGGYDGYGGEEGEGYMDVDGEGGRRRGGSGWDEGSGTYKKGVAVR